MNLFLFFLVFLVTQIECKNENQNEIIFTDTITTFDQNYLNLSVTLENSTINILMKSNKIIDQAQLEYQLKYRDNKNALITILDKQMDFCNFLILPITDPLLNLVYVTIINNKKNKIFRKCPILPVRLLLKLM